MKTELQLTLEEKLLELQLKIGELYYPLAIQQMQHIGLKGEKKEVLLLVHIM